MAETVLLCGAFPVEELRGLLGRFGISLEQVPDGAPITGSWFGEPEAGIVGHTTIVRSDTPVHSAMHETCHMICMDAERRARLHTDAGGDYDEENAVNYLQLTLAAFLPSMGQERMFADMDRWGYTFRLGDARSWFEQDAQDARQWLLSHGLLNHDGTPTWQLRQ